MKKKIIEWFTNLFTLMAGIGLVWVVFLAAGYGWHQGKEIANMQSNLKLLELYIEKQEG